MDAMSQTLSPLQPLTPFHREQPQEFETYRTAFVGVAKMIPANVRRRVLIDLLSLAVKEDLHDTVSEPAWMVKALEVQGEAVVARLIKDNWSHIGTVADVVEKFEFSKSGLHRLKDENKVICYRPDGETEFLFPLDQFKSRGVHDWATQVVTDLGNGGGALHFLFVPRNDLAGKSFMDVWRDTPDKAEAEIRKALKYLTRE